MSATEQRRLAAIMFTDMVGYTALSQRNESLALELLEEHRRILRTIFPRFNGTEIKTIGDAFLVEFQSALEAAQCALEIQRTLAKRNPDVSAERHIELRIGIHVGDVVHREGDVYGDGVNIASRIQPVAGIGGICISVDVERQIHHALDARFEKLAPVELKNVEVPMELFRIVLPWEAKASPWKSEAPATAGKLHPKSDTNNKRIFAISMAVVLLLVGLLGYQLWRTRNQSAPSKQSVAIEAPVKSIAVLPLVNSTGDPANEYFSDGMSEEFISSLSRLQELKVIGRTSSFQFKGKTGDSKTIGEKLGVHYLLEGSVRKSAERVRIAVALTNASDGANVWSETYDRELKDIFAVQSEIAAAVAKELKVALLGSAGQGARLATAATPSNQNVEAYNALLQGNFYSNRRTAEDLRKAIGSYEEAIRLDPRYPLAYAKLAEAAIIRATNFVALTAKEREDLIAKARASAERALQLDPNLADAHAAQGLILERGEFNFAAAESETRRAVELAPQNPDANHRLAFLTSELGRLDEAAALQQRAIALDPLRASFHLNLAIRLMALGRNAEAEEALRRAIELQPSAASYHATLARLQTLQGNPAAALESARQETDPFWRTHALAMAYFANGDRNDADAALQKLIDENARDAGFQIAAVYALRKEPEKMFEWLEHAWATRDSGLTELLTDPFLLAYKDDPRFIAFAQKIGVMPKTARKP